MPRTLTLACVAWLVLAPAARPQEKPKSLPGDAMIEKYLAAETDKLSQKFMDGAKSLEEWKEKRPRLHREYLDMLGLWPLPAKTPLNATVTGQVEGHGVVVEKLHFQSKPGLYVTANLYRPKDVTGKLPAILYVCGHSGRGRDGGRTAFQDHGFWFANNGYVCLIVDTLQLGEIPGIHHGTYGIRGKEPVETRPWWHSAGYTPAGVECWNGVRAIDYLLTRPEVDPDKLGVTGISGGGAATFWIAAADDRVKVAVPVSGMSDLESYVKNKVINGHCDCMFLYNTHGWEWTTIAALVAPRPILFANSDNDPIFPMDGNRRIIAKLRKLYAMYDQPGLADEYVSEGGHAYRPDLRVAIFKFLNKHLKGDATSPVEDSAKFTELPGKQLRVFPENSDLPKDALNGKIDETFVPRAEVKLPAEGKFEVWKKELIAELRRTVFRALPEKAIEAKIVKSTHIPSYYVETRTGRELESHMFFLVKNKRVDMVLGWHARFLRKDEKTLETVLGSKVDEAYLLKSNFCAFDIGRPWPLKSPPNYDERSRALLGWTADVENVDDIRSMSRLHKQKEGTRVIGKGHDAILAAYAALFEPSIMEVVVIDPPTSHKDGPHFLGVLRVLDIPDALGLLAPTPLTIIGGNDPAFDRTAQLYRLAGAADKLTRK